MSIFKNSSIYLLGNIINAAIPFLLLPILTRTFSQEEYGELAMFQTLILALSAVIGCNTVGAATRKYFDKGSDEDDLKQYNGSCFQITFISILFVTLCVAIGVDYISYYVKLSSTWIVLAIIVSTFNYIISFRLSQWQIRNRAIIFGILQVLRSLINISMSIVLVLFLNYGVDGRVDAILLTSVLIGGLSFYLLYRDKLISVSKFNKKFILESARFGLPLIPHTLGIFFISSIDRFIIAEFLGLGEAGTYMVAVQLSLSLVIIFDALNKAFVPWLFSHLNDGVNHVKAKIVKYSYIFMAFLLLIPVLVFAFGDIIVFVVGDNYSRITEIIALLCLGQCFGGMYLMVTNYIFYAKKTEYLGVITILTGAINVALALSLVNLFGLQGVALSFAISKFIQFILTWIVAANSVPMPWFRIS